MTAGLSDQEQRENFSPKAIPFGSQLVSPLMRARRSHGEDGISDEALLSGMAAGDEQAGMVFVRRYQHRLYGLAIGIVRDASLAEDVAQEAFIRIFRHAAVFDARRGSVSAWTLAIARNLAIDVLRVRRATPTEPNDRIFLELMTTGQRPEDVTINQNALDQIRAPLARLPIDQRRAVVLAAMYGWSATEIAQAEAIPLGTAKSRIRLGMAKLRKMVVIEETP
jgi:RNA polymerase sigma factor (sigma-70 family)